jgi:anaerobic selenocysteine-containing dehydrogenase
MSDTWKPTACLICSLNCGIEVQTEGGHITRVRADKNHPVSQGYLCEKAQRMDAYQQGRDRLSSPMRRRGDGTYEAIDWDTAISEIAAKLAAVRDEHGGESIFYYGGGAQGNHLPGVYSQSTLAALGVRYRSNALAQEKTGEAWVQARMFGCGIHHDFEHAEVGLLIGKNPWQSHGFPRARLVLREIAADPNRALIVIDPRKSETAAMADFHLAIRPGTDAWCLGALAAILVQDGLANREWMAEHVANAEPVLEALSRIPVSQFAEVCGVEEALLRSAARRMAAAETMASMEDLGMQMGVHSTLGSYLHRLIIGLTGAFGRKGTSYAFIPFRPLGAGGGGASPASKTSGERNFRRSPVTGFPVVMGLIPCNAITEEILTDHPHRFRAMIVESANPVHSLADSARMREALRALDVSVVIDVAMTETARAADYVLPASSQFEKAEASFFNFEPEANAFQLRHPLFPPREGTREEGAIHAALCVALGVFGEAEIAPLRAAAEQGFDALAMAFMQTISANPALMPVASALLYRALGPVLPEGLSNAAGVWGVAQLFVQSFPEEAARAGYAGPLAGNRLFEAILGSPSGTVFARQDSEDSWKRLRSPGQQINLHIPEMIEALLALDPAGPPRDADYPFILSAGERRTETSNTSIRNPDWLRKGELESTLRIHPEDAAALGLADGAAVEVVSRRSRARTVVEVHDGNCRGHVSLPNGLGLDVAGSDGAVRRHGVALNELTDYRWRDPVVGTPWHKYVPVRLEPVS